MKKDMKKVGCLGIAVILIAIVAMPAGGAQLPINAGLEQEPKTPIGPGWHAWAQVDTSNILSTTLS